MKKTIISVAVAAAAFGTQVSAVELYNQDGSTFAMGGHVTAAVGASDNTNNGNTQVQTISPRINFEATQQISDAVTVDAKGEWQMNMLDGGKETFKTRLGYIGATHEQLGRIAVGTQWSPFYVVAKVADAPIIFANEFLYDNQYALGTARSEKMAAYSNTFEFGETSSLYVGAGWQGATTSVLAGTEHSLGNRAQLATVYSIAGVKMGVAHTTGKIHANGEANNKDAKSTLASLSYGSYGNGLYVAGVYGDNENMNNASTGLISKSKVYEGLLAYALDNSLNLSVNYEEVKDDAENYSTMRTSALQAEYHFSPSLVGAAGYEFDLRSDDDRAKGQSAKNDQWKLAVRYYL
ncbi:porin [Vibrio sp.]|uniref:porin n=1 Tax=Vibrio sp. TaxID=678 RepID=UPI003D0E14D2